MAGKMVPAWALELFEKLSEFKGETNSRLTAIETTLKQVSADQDGLLDRERNHLVQTAPVVRNGNGHRLRQYGPWGGMGVAVVTVAGLLVERLLT